MKTESLWKRWMAGVMIVGLTINGTGVAYAAGAPRSGNVDDRLRALEAEIEQLEARARASRGRAARR